MNNHIVIMAGGIGSRFWPLSTPEFPKQFIDILGCGRTLIQLTVDRFKGLCPMENFWVVTNAAYVDIVRRQLPEMPVNHILAEPAARNTAPCIAWACWRIKAEDPEANVVVTPADAVVMNPEEFRRVIGNALNFTEKSDAIVTIGIKPSRPETGYGYVEVESGKCKVAPRRGTEHLGKEKQCSEESGKLKVVIEIPDGEHVSTKEAYLGLNRDLFGALRPDLRKAVKQPIEEWRNLIVNDFEASVFPAHPAIAELKDDMYRRGALYYSMTGSGAAVFGIFPK